MSHKKTNVYTDEFRESTVKLMIESDQPVAQTAQKLGVKEALKKSLPSSIIRLSTTA